MFPYFGKKLRMAGAYPPAEHNLIIEPFAGSMGYTLYCRPKRALGIEADPEVVALWARCLDQKLPLPKPEVGTKTTDLLVKLCSYSEHALTSRELTVTSRMVRDWDTIQARILEQAQWVREHVTYTHASYEDAPDVVATWFIDPPYQHANRRGYAKKLTDYARLADWVRSRRGQVIVCEQEGADWLPFQPLYGLSSHRGSKSTEVLWTP